MVAYMIIPPMTGSRPFSRSESIHTWPSIARVKEDRVGMAVEKAALSHKHRQRILFQETIVVPLDNRETELLRRASRPSRR